MSLKLIDGKSSDSESKTDIWLYVEQKTEITYVAKIFLLYPFTYKGNTYNEQFGDLYLYESSIYRYIDSNYGSSPLFVKFYKYETKKISDLLADLKDFFSTDNNIKTSWLNFTPRGKNLFLNDINVFVDLLSKKVIYNNINYLIYKLPNRHSITEFNSNTLNSVINDINIINNDYNEIKDIDCGIIFTEYEKEETLQVSIQDIPDVTSVITTLLFGAFKLTKIYINHVDLHFGNIMTRTYNYRKFFILFKDKLYRLNINILPRIYDYDRSTHRNQKNIYLEQLYGMDATFRNNMDYLKILCSILKKFKLDNGMKKVLLSFIENENLRNHVDSSSNEHCWLDNYLFRNPPNPPVIKFASEVLRDSDLDGELLLEWFLSRHEWIPIRLIFNRDNNKNNRLDPSIPEDQHPWIYEIYRTIKEMSMIRDYKKPFEAHFNNVFEYDDINIRNEISRRVYSLFPPGYSFL
jgi:hypothetical protein